MSSLRPTSATDTPMTTEPLTAEEIAMTVADTITVPDGMELTDCTAEPRHTPVFVPVDEDAWCPTPCPWCMADDHWQRVLKLEGAEQVRKHRRHRWYSNRVVHWLFGWAYQLGIVAAYGYSWNQHCKGCLDYIRVRGRRCYVLGWPTWKWSCLLRSHHWPGDFIGLDSCAKCLPCPTCDSTTAGHEPDCADNN
jgi:hypothetical protein